MTLVAHTRRLDHDVDLIDVAGPNGHFFEGGTDGHGLAGRGIGAVVEIPAGRRHEAGRLVALSLGSIQTAPGSDPLGPAIAALAALPFDRSAAGRALIPSLTVRRLADGTRWLTLVGEPDDHGLPSMRSGVGQDLVAPPAQPAQAGPTSYVITPVTTPAAHEAAVARAVAAIGAGVLDKVVLARAVDVEADAPFDLAVIQRSLRARYATSYRLSIDGFIAASPELLVSRAGDIVRARPMAGTVARLGDPMVDAQLAAKLMSSAHFRHEHRVTIDEVHDVLLPFCSYVDSQAEPEVAAMANVQHLASHVEGRLSHPLPSVLDLVAALHPTPAVGGRPVDAALALMAELETVDRGRYGGPSGWVDADGNGEFVVSVRSAEVLGNRARMFAGGGIVKDSDPAAEVAETRPKLLPMLNSLVQP